MIKLGVLGSGAGTNFEEIAKKIAAGEIKNAEIAVVISDVRDAKILEKAEKMGLKALYLPADDFKTKLDGPQEAEYIRVLKENGVDYVILAGFMRMVKKGLLEAFPMKVVNIHPALLPAFPGLESCSSCDLLLFWRCSSSHASSSSGSTMMPFLRSQPLFSGRDSVLTQPPSASLIPPIFCCYCSPSLLWKAGQPAPSETSISSLSIPSRC